ncbi:hypothetical protein GLOTRDRAFT_94806 [Gloeophyllum trabeum ATCC 11539]|uniref:Uncharacterized protein n=1 Tax=Gloeophyllum trabeum (strain ATCC 11539 / FP-39264 / Madison 617) TaxID=670483 RepID=S7Q216_GLOTA|nr:uncharacterized protein GLOTRDRAFT_94806 [Gloeophyllum trabeum ATCC 11539]EPQ53598.1 hypothetical protein GLOTRDRAFT_94806 [Gloeophyllum trabeum ATCC 11539]
MRIEEINSKAGGRAFRGSRGWQSKNFTAAMVQYEPRADTLQFREILSDNCQRQHLEPRRTGSSCHHMKKVESGLDRHESPTAVFRIGTDGAVDKDLLRNRVMQKVQYGRETKSYARESEAFAPLVQTFSGKPSAGCQCPTSTDTAKNAASNGTRTSSEHAARVIR